MAAGGAGGLGVTIGAAGGGGVGFTIGGQPAPVDF